MNTIKQSAAALALATLALAAAPAAMAGESLAEGWLATQFSTTHDDGRTAPVARDGQRDGHGFAQAWLARQLTTGHTRVDTRPSSGATALATESDFIRLWLHRQFAPDHSLPRG
ncbi:MAG: hypothetical protein KDH20_00330 [Rhodocyclaceae bacterium]|nr:hypothetical protein [Rhodocyclaceae bacterium]